MMANYRIVDARPRDLHLIGAIELAAAKLLRGHAPDTVLNEITNEQDLRDAQSQGRLWVALRRDTPVGFAHVEVLEPNTAHLEEIDVHPDHGRRGLGRRLVTEVCRWAEKQSYPDVTLTTFRDIPWNMPFYARLGFEEIPTAALTPTLRSVLQDEARRGLDPARRVAMRWRVQSNRACLIGEAQGKAPCPAAITIRPAVSEDANGIARTFLESAEYHARLDPERYSAPAVETIVARYRERRQHPPDTGGNGITLVAELRGEVVGFIDARLEQSLDAMHREMTYCHIAEIAVSCRYQKQGIGGRLLRAAEDWGRRQGAEFASLEYHAANKHANGFYQRRMGYCVVSITAIKRL